MRADLSSERPSWILSAYGPGKQAPEQLFGGFPREQSFEEMRLRHYDLTAKGQQQQAIQEAESIVANAQQQIRNTLENINGAVRYIIDSQQRHPNRLDICNAGRNTGLALSNGIPVARPLGFGTASAPGHVSSSLSNPPLSRVSTAGLHPNPFAAITNQFTAPISSGLGNTGSFSALPFGKNPHLPKESYNSNPLPPPKFLSGTENPFAQIAMEQRQSDNTMDTTRGLGIADRAPAFGVVEQKTTLVPSSTSSAVGMTRQAKDKQTVFGSTTPGGLGFANDAIMDASGKLVSWNGQNVSYIGGEPCFQRRDGPWERIWFPAGFPVWRKEDCLAPGTYNESLEKEYGLFRDVNSSGRRGMPDLPPRREWCSWNF